MPDAFCLPDATHIYMICNLRCSLHAIELKWMTYIIMNSWSNWSHVTSLTFPVKVRQKLYLLSSHLGKKLGGTLIVSLMTYLLNYFNPTHCNIKAGKVTVQGRDALSIIFVTLFSTVDSQTPCHAKRIVGRS